MFEQSGESYGAKTEDAPRCPGEKDCGMFNLAKSETGDGDEACRGCELLPTKGKTVYPKERCPGETACSHFVVAAGANRAEKEIEACTGGDLEKPLCPLFRSKPAPNTPAVEIENDDAEAVESLVEVISDIVFWESAGSATDWTHYPFEVRQLFGIWREAEKQVNRIQQARMQMFIKSFAGAK